MEMNIEKLVTKFKSHPLFRKVIAEAEVEEKQVEQRKAAIGEIEQIRKTSVAEISSHNAALQGQEKKVRDLKEELKKEGNQLIRMRSQAGLLRSNTDQKIAERIGFLLSTCPAQAFAELREHLEKEMEEEKRKFLSSRPLGLRDLPPPSEEEIREHNKQVQAFRDRYEARVGALQAMVAHLEEIKVSVAEIDLPALEAEVDDLING